MPDLRHRLTRANILIGIALLVTGGLIGGAVATVPTGKVALDSRGKAEKKAESEDGVRGGSVERVHDAGVCNLTDLSKLGGNWTHGDYVNAVAALGDKAKMKEAAKSACGKPLKAKSRGNAKAKGHEDQDKD